MEKQSESFQFQEKIELKKGVVLTFDVQITSRKLMFIHVSQLTKCPL